MPWQSVHKHARISARKARLIADLIRGCAVQDAINILKFTPNRAAGMLSKVLTSAIANANEAEADVDRLYVDTVKVDEGPTMKRWRLRARSRAFPILKRTSHITVVVEQEQD